MKKLFLSVRFYLFKLLSGIFKTPALYKKKILYGIILLGVIGVSSCGGHIVRTCYKPVPTDDSFQRDTLNNINQTDSTIHNN